MANAIAPNLGGMTTGRDGKIDKLIESRHADYGHPSKNLTCIAELWTSYLRRVVDANGGAIEITATDVCTMNILQKASRNANDDTKLDNWDDIQGYAECAKKCLAASEPAE